VVAATVTGLLVAPTTAAGVTDTCQGRPATIVADSDGGTGTEGDDVIVSHTPSSTPSAETISSASTPERSMPETATTRSW
jgi:hypothetical protein